MTAPRAENRRKSEVQLFDLLQAQSVSAEGILVSLADVPEQSGQQYYGMWLTLERQFFRFSVVILRDTGEFELETAQRGFACQRHFDMFMRLQ